MVREATPTRLRRGTARPGVTADVADHATETAVAVFWIAFERWVTGPYDVDPADVIKSTLTTLSGLTA